MITNKFERRIASKWLGRMADARNRANRCEMAWTIRGFADRICGEGFDSEGREGLYAEDYRQGWELGGHDFMEGAVFSMIRGGTDFETVEWVIVRGLERFGLDE